MSRNGAGQFTLDPRYLVSEGDTILPSQHNPVLEDLQTDANTPRPIVAGGTGASTATTARTNLSVYSIADVDDGFTPKVATRTALKALDTATTKAVVLTEASRQKLFMWMTGDFTDSVAGDPSELAYIPADGIDPALGCWVAVTGAGASIVPVIQGGTGANDAATALGNLGGMASATYDPNAVAGDAFDMANMAEATDAKIMTAAERTAIAGAAQKSANLSDLTSASTALSNLGGDAAGISVFQQATKKSILDLLSLGFISPKALGAPADGTSHPLSDAFATLSDAQAVYPHAQALTDETDWAVIQGAINDGIALWFSGGSYRLNRQISITTDNVRIDGDRTSTIVPDMDYFTNNTRAGELGATGCIILATGSYTSPYTPIDKLLIRGLRFDGGSVDDRRTTIIAVKNAKNPVVEGNESENFAVGYFVYGEAITGDQSRIWLNYAHDWYSDASYGGDNQTSQTTVVGIDDGALPDNSRSDGIDIGWNCGARLVKGPTLLAALGQQTDVVNILNRVSKNHKIHHNTGREIDELVDCFGTDCDIYENRGWDITASIVKLAHGANGNHVHHNRGWNVSRWPIVLNAAPTDVDNIENNHVHDNYIYGIVDSADARGCVTLLDGGTGAAPYVQNNYFSNNYLDPGAGGQSCIHASISGGNGNFFSNDIFVQEGTLGWVSGGTEGVKRARIQKPQRATHFRCRLGSAQNLTALSTKLDFSDVADDMRSEWDATNKRWVCQLPGRYRIGVDLRANAWPASTVFSIRIKVNGAEVAQKDFNFANASSQGLDFNREFQLYSGDYVEVYVVFASTPNVVLTQGGAYSLLTIDML